MNQIRLTCKKCGESVTATYQSYQGHELTEQTLAIARATKNHKCHKS